jgi:Ring finger domain
MNNELNVNNEREFRRFIDRVNALSCIRFLIIMELIIKALKVISIAIVLYIKRNEECKVPLKLFLGVYMLFSAAKAVAFFSKNKSFFYIQRIPEFEDNNDITLVNNFLEAVMLFWYILGFHWIQECDNCKFENPLLYYTTLIWISLGFFTFIAPLLAIVFLLLLVAYIRPKLKVITYNDENDIPDDNTRCTICFDDYRKGNRIKFLPCDHHFHVDCIDEWFNVKDSCPLCKKNINLLYDLVDASETSI